MRSGTHAILAGLAAAIVFAMPLAEAGDTPTVLYRLQPGSTYEEGCYNQCMCPIVQAPLEGTFGLRLLPTAAPFDTYAVEQVDLSVPALNHVLTGSGFFSPLGELNRMELDLVLNGEPRLFTSGGFVPAGAEFPEIEIVVSVNQMASCFDYVMHIVASPHTTPYPELSVAMTELTWSAAEGADNYDVVCGDLTALRGSGGDFGGSTDECIAAEAPATSTTYDQTPAQGTAVWFLVRDHAGSYDSAGSAQAGSRDDEIDSAGPACPP
ncbi:MAG: hypothetical protein GY716_17940 [bacterium]|nr:hypothetical protein [bacterium]